MRGHLDYFWIVKVQPRHRVAGLGCCRLFFNAKRLARRIELNHAITLWIVDRIRKTVSFSALSVPQAIRRDRVPAYASGALTRTTPTDKLERAAAALVEKGYRQIKAQMAVEGLNAVQEVERIRLIRSAVGQETNLLVDINQRWGVHEAISIGRRVEELGLGWLEDPTRCDDYQGLAKIADALATPICAGEYLYGIEPHRQTLAHHSVDIAMIDLLRVGGVTQWMKVAGMTEAFNRPVASHLLPEIHVHLIAAVPNGLVVEYMPWTWRLFENPPIPEKGEIAVPTGAGLGLKFASDLFDKYGVGSND